MHVFFNRSHDLPHHFTKIQNSLCSVLSCLIIKLYNKINSVLCTFHAYICPVFVHQKVHWKVHWTNCPARQPPDNVGDCNDLNHQQTLFVDGHVTQHPPQPAVNACIIHMCVLYYRCIIHPPCSHLTQECMYDHLHMCFY